MARMRPVFVLACSLASFSLAACDLMADGKEIVLSNGGLVLGSFAPPGRDTAVPAATVTRGGSLVVANASLLGGNALVSSLDRETSPASAILARSGSLRIESGLIRAGELAFTRQLGIVRQGIPGIDALDTRVEVNGGTIEGGPAAGFSPLDGLGQSPEQGGIGLSVTQGELRITGGVFRQGRSFPPGLDLTRSVATRDTTVDIRGGDFRDGSVLLDRSRSRISGGRFRRIEVLGTSCTEIRGGALPGLFISGRDARLVIFGSNFSAGSGLLQIPPAQLFRLTGVLADGTPLDVQIDQRENPTILLTSPTQPGCL